MTRVTQTEDGYGNMGMITHVCICGSRVFNLQVVFDEYEISWYNLEMECAVCGTLWTAPTPVDNPDNNGDNYDF